jgi:hypothetical protein
MTTQGPSAPFRQGHRMRAGRSFAHPQRGGVRGPLCQLRRATESPWRGPLTRHLGESTHIPASPKPGEARSAQKRDCPAKAREGAAR